MKSSHRGTRYAVVGFILMSFVVVGGMTWATFLTWRLAEVDVENEWARKTREALWKIDDYVGRIRASEASRQVEDFVALRHPENLMSKDLEDLDAAQFFQPSSIAIHGPRASWIQLYFQVDRYGRWSSPQVPQDAGSWVADVFDKDPAVIGRARQLLDWLSMSLSVDTLSMNINQALKNIDWSIEEEEIVTTEHESPTPARQSETQVAPAKAQSKTPPDYAYRQTTQQRLQERSRPSPKCVPEEIAEANVGNKPLDTRYALPHVCSESYGAGVEVAVSPMVPIWLTPGWNEPQSIAFVRQAIVGPQYYFQGFVANWSSLKTELLGLITPLFPQADLDPVFWGPPFALEENTLALSQLPVTLKIPKYQAGHSALAWKSVRGVLIASWAAALAVLAIAGWGVWNLVALTERRLQFAYSVTHELRTPLTTFRLYTDMLSANLVPDSAKQEYLDTLNRESGRLSSLVESVLEYARLENHKVRLNPVRTDGPGLLQTLEEELKSRCQVNGITPVVKCDISNGINIRTDIDLVGQVVNVLVNNACRHARQSQNPVVLLHLTGENGMLELNVIDSGPGVERADSRCIFKPFRRGRRAVATAQGGVGLGLALARNWAGLMGGQLELAARHHPQYGGAHFRLTIPAQMKVDLD